MGQIILLAFGAAVFPALLACVAILLSRPSPRRLLLAFYVGGVIASVGSGLWVLSHFDHAESLLGSTQSTPNPGASIVQGLVGLALAWAMTSKRVTARADRWRAAYARRHPKAEKQGPSRVERTLDRANTRVAFLVGAAINLPGPFYLLALGDIAQGAYSRGQEIALVLLFNAIMF